MTARPGRPAGKKGSSVGSGGNNKRRLAGKGPTPPGEARKNHPKAKAAAAARKAAATRAARPAAAPTKLAFNPAAPDGPETVVGRNPVVEGLRAKVPGTTLYVALGIDIDDRIREAGMLAQRADIPIVEVERRELDRITSSGMHQGLALVVPPYSYSHPDELLARAQQSGSAPLLVALDSVTDPRNLGAAVRSAAAFGAHGVLVPERRSAGITASAWRTSAGAVARMPVGQAVNLTRALEAWKSAGVFTVGLAADGEVDLDDLELALDPLCVVVGSEGKGLSRLVSQACDVRVSIPMADKIESLNASVAVSVVLAEVARRRRIG